MSLLRVSNFPVPKPTRLNRGWLAAGPAEEVTVSCHDTGMEPAEMHLQQADLESRKPTVRELKFLGAWADRLHQFRVLERRTEKNV